jgi:hypothetical protein
MALSNGTSVAVMNKAGTVEAYGVVGELYDDGTALVCLEDGTMETGPVGMLLDLDAEEHGPDPDAEDVVAGEELDAMADEDRRSVYVPYAADYEPWSLS